jgi:hypothetical protein
MADRAEVLERLLRERMERTEALIALGKGKWPEKSYVKDEQWACWHHEVMTIKSVLFAYEHTKE